MTVEESAAGQEEGKGRESSRNPFGRVSGISVPLVVGLDGGRLAILVVPRLDSPSFTSTKLKSHNSRFSSNKSMFGVSCMIPSFANATSAVTSPASCFAHASFKTASSSACS